MKRGHAKTIVLTGPKHAGKTSAGKALASLCGSSFFDLDELVEKAAGKSPRELYREGAEVFRQAEAAATRALLESGDAKSRVIAAGGGLIDNPQALELLKTHGAFLVYIEIAAATAWERIRSGGELPPFLQTENPKETHRLLHERRAEAYRRVAKLVINAEGKSPRQIAEEIAG